MASLSEQTKPRKSSFLGLGSGCSAPLTPNFLFVEAVVAANLKWGVLQGGAPKQEKGCVDMFFVSPQPMQDSTTVVYEKNRLSKSRLYSSYSRGLSSWPMGPSPQVLAHGCWPMHGPIWPI